MAAAKLARESASALVARDFATAIARAHAALNERPTNSTTLGLAYRSLGYGYAYMNDRTNAAVWLQQYRPFCTNDCRLVDAFLTSWRGGPR